MEFEGFTAKNDAAQVVRYRIVGLHRNKLAEGTGGLVQDGDPFWANSW